MSNSVTPRLLAVCGMAYGVMEIVGDSLSRTPSSGSSPTQIADYLAAHAPSAGSWAGMYVETLGAFALLFFGVYLWSLAQQQPAARMLGVLALSATAIQVAVILSGEPPKAAAFYRAGSAAQPQLVAVLIDINNGSFRTGFLAQALLTAAASGLTFRAGLFPRWLGVIGILVAVGLVAVVFAPASSDLPVAVNLVFFVWLAVISAILAWRSPEPAAARSLRQEPV